MNKFSLNVFICISLFSDYLIAYPTQDASKEDTYIGQQFVISKNFSSGRNISSKGQVFYFIASDAYRTMQARKFQDWSFAEVDTRNIYRVLKNDSVRIVGTKFSGNILEVKLLSGSDKGKNYFAIKDEIEKNFLSLEIDETT
jgi:hypothetical protein